SARCCGLLGIETVNTFERGPEADRAFVYNANPARIVFGVGAVSQVAKELKAAGASRALVLSTPFQKAEAERLAASLGDLAAGVFAGAALHPPVEGTLK